VVRSFYDVLLEHDTLVNMAFHFDARGDSSSDDDNDAPDLTAWKAGVSRGILGGGRAPTAPMLPQSNEEGRLDKRISPTRSPSRQSLEPADELEGGSSGVEELDVQSIGSSRDAREHSNGYRRVSPSVRKLVVEISRSEAADKDEFLDLRDGADTVKRVLREISGEHDEILYQALFDDFHVELVRWFILLALLLPFTVPLRLGLQVLLLRFTCQFSRNITWHRLE
jgi:hypothetical protein